MNHLFAKRRFVASAPVAATVHPEGRDGVLTLRDALERRSSG